MQAIPVAFLSSAFRFGEFPLSFSFSACEGFATEMQRLEQIIRRWGFHVAALVVILAIFSRFFSPTGGAIAAASIIMAFAFFRNLLNKLTRKSYPEDDGLPKYTFYDTIEEFGYHFNEEGELVDDNGGRFNFLVRENDRNYNQQHYDALGDLVTEYLYGKMETDLKLERVYLPVDAKPDEPKSFIFKTKDAERGDNLMVIINGAGVVRAGQWSRKLIINESIEVGTQFPYIRRAVADGYGVVVLNTNENYVMVDGQRKEIRSNGSAEDHGLYVWEHIISQTRAKNIAIVAHSYGGIVTCTIGEKFLDDFKKRVFCVVFTDSVHITVRACWSQPLADYMKQRAVNFSSAYVPLNMMMNPSSPLDCLSVSAGTVEHERTSHCCIESAFKFIQDNYATWTKDGTMAPRNFLPLPDDLSQYSPAKAWKQRWQSEKTETDSEPTSTSNDDNSPVPEKMSKAMDEVKVQSLKPKNGERPGGNHDPGIDNEEKAVSETEKTEVETEKAGTETKKVGTETEQAGTETEKVGTETEQVGTEKAGIENVGIEKAGTEMAGTEQAGIEQAGTEQAGTENAGIEQAGTEQAGTEKAGTEKAETEKVGTEKAGTETEQAGTETEQAGTEKAGTVTEKVGTENAGTEKAGTEKAGTEKAGTEQQQ